LGNVLNDGIFTNVGNGVYEVTVTSTKEGQETLGFTIDGKAATATTPLEYVGDDGIDLNKSTMTATPAAILANNVETSLVVVDLVFANGQKPTAQPGVVFITGLDIGSTDTGAMEMAYVGDGRYELAVKSATVGRDTVSYRFGKDAATLVNGGQAVTIDYIRCTVDLTTCTIEINPGTIEANGVARANVTVRLRDAAGHAIVDSQGAVVVEGLSIGNVMPAAHLEYQENGIYTGVITSTQTG